MTHVYASVFPLYSASIPAAPNRAPASKMARPLQVESVHLKHHLKDPTPASLAVVRFSQDRLLYRAKVGQAFNFSA